MTHPQLLDSAQSTHGLDRVHYFPRQLLTADDMAAEQRYFQEKLRRHNRFLHGWGVVCGLEVRPAPTDDAPWRVHIDAGLALGPYGDEVHVPKAMFLDLARCGAGTTTDPCAPNRLQRPGSATSESPVFIAIKYAECVARPVQVLPSGCACDESACEYSRIRDSFQIECLSELPASHQSDETSLSLCDYIATQQLMPFLSSPTDAWVVLARVDLPSDSTAALAADQINNFVRRQLYSTAVLQEMVITCCCEDAPPEPPTPVQVIETVPADGETVSQPDSILIKFNQKLNLDTVKTDSIEVIYHGVGGGAGGVPYTPYDDRVSGTLLYNLTNTEEVEIRFSPENSFFVGGRSPNYTVIVRGSGKNAIEGENGMQLDGNNDGIPGEDYTISFDM